MVKLSVLRNMNLGKPLRLYLAWSKLLWRKQLARPPSHGTGTVPWCPEWWRSVSWPLKIFKRPPGYAISLHPSPMASSPGFYFYNKLPSDVQRLIFEEAFEASDWRAVELAHVSREVRDWWVLVLPHDLLSLNQFVQDRASCVSGCCSLRISFITPQHNTLYYVLEQDPRTTRNWKPIYKICTAARGGRGPNGRETLAAMPEPQESSTPVSTSWRSGNISSPFCP